MTRAANSDHLGGIGAMLEVAPICPRCGKRLSDSPQAALWHLEGNGCRPVVYAALPEPAAVDDDPPVPAERQIHDFEAPVPRSRSAAPFENLTAPLFPSAGRALAIPWLRPPDLGEVL